jgi:hypothetical protein
MAGISQQGDRIADHAINCLDHHEAEIKGGADRKRLAEAGRCM